MQTKNRTISAVYTIFHHFSHLSDFIWLPISLCVYTFSFKCNHFSAWKNCRKDSNELTYRVFLSQAYAHARLTMLYILQWNFLYILNSSFKISCHCKVELSSRFVDSIIHIEWNSKNRKERRNGINTPSKCVSLRLGLLIVFHLKYDGVLSWMPSSNQESFTVMPSKNVILSFWWDCIVFGDKCNRISNISEDLKH